MHDCMAVHVCFFNCKFTNIVSYDFCKKKEMS